jgi:hypothetical protein
MGTRIECASRGRCCALRRILSIQILWPLLVLSKVCTTLNPAFALRFWPALPVAPCLGEVGVKRQYFDGRSPYNLRIAPGVLP